MWPSVAALPFYLNRGQFFALGRVIEKVEGEFCFWVY